MANVKLYECQKAQRLDVFLAAQIDETRSQVAQLIKQENVLVNQKIVTRPGVKLKIGEKVEVHFPQLQETESFDGDFIEKLEWAQEVKIIYEDDDLLVINKPSGVTVHPAPSVKEATLVDWLKYKGVRLSTLSGEERHGIVHRLDKGTSGAMVIAKNNESHQFLSEQLQDKSMGRYYLAIITPPLKDLHTVIESNIGRSAHNRLKMACVEHGKTAKTKFATLSLSNDETVQLIACKLYTGRTHQIRVHLESISRHILGDHIYAVGPKQGNPERILLHAYIIYFIHPRTKKELFFVADLDQEMRKQIEKKFNLEHINEVMETNNILNSFSSHI